MENDVTEFYIPFNADLTKSHLFQKPTLYLIFTNETQSVN